MAKTAVLVLSVLGLAAPGLAQQVGPASPAPSSGATIQLSMDQAVEMAFETNLGLKANRLDVDIASEGIAGARAAFRPLLRSSFSQSTSDQQPSDFTQTASSVITSRSTAFSSTIVQNLSWLGGAYSVQWAGNRNTTTYSLSPFNPKLGSSLSLAYQQPLLRNFLIDANRVTLQTAERTRNIADLALQTHMETTRSRVQQAYLNLIAANEGLKVAQQNMDLAQENLRNFKARVAVGVSADIDVIQAEAGVASNEEQLIVAQAGIGTAEDVLRALVVDPARPDYWQVHLQPTDTIVATPPTADVDRAVANALANRLDLLTARRQKEITVLGVRLDENLTRPDLSFGLNYSAQGTGGTEFTFGSGFPPPIVGRNDKTFSSVLNDAVSGAYPSWSAGFTLSYPLGLSAARATLAQARLQSQQQDLAIKDLEVQVAASVRTAVRDVETNYKRVEATQKAREATERQLDAEQRKFGVGLSTSFELQQRQRDLSQARISELNAKILYNLSLIALERVQKIQ
jgi:outer membrane protein TolC